MLLATGFVIETSSSAGGDTQPNSSVAKIEVVNVPSKL